MISIIFFFKKNICPESTKTKQPNYTKTVETLNMNQFKSSWLSNFHFMDVSLGN